MGFIRGVIAGVAVAAGAAAWYMSRAGSKFRDRYRVDRKLGEFGDEIETRTRDVRSKVTAQVSESRSQATGATPDAIADTLDEARGRRRRGGGRDRRRCRGEGAPRSSEPPSRRASRVAGGPVPRRKVTYPPPKTANRPAPPSGLPDDAPYVRPTVAIIDLNAEQGPRTD